MQHLKINQTDKPLRNLFRSSIVLVSAGVLSISSALFPLASQMAVAEAPVTHTIASCSELRAMDDDADTRGDTFKLTADIDCESTLFTPLDWTGDGDSSEFNGVFDGQGHSISGINVTVDGANAGLFDFLYGATIKNLTLASGTVHSIDAGDGSGYAGSLAPAAENVTIMNVVSHIDVTSDNSDAAGLIADIYSSEEGETTIVGAASTGDVSGNGYAGGLIGYTYNSGGSTFSIERSYSTSAVTSVGDFRFVGGLVGYLSAGENDEENPTDATVTVSDVFAQGAVNAPESRSVGGLVGQIDTRSGGSSVAIRNAYASGDVSADQFIGGLVGAANYEFSEGATTISNAFSVSELDVQNGDPLYYGFLIGNNDLELPELSENKISATGTNLYYDSTNSGIQGWWQAACAWGENDIDDCTDVNADGTHDTYFLGNNSVEPMASWNFDTIWQVNAGALPTFQSEELDDNDGVTTEVEAAAPNNGDGNNDGTPDSEQAYVTSLVDPVTQNYITLAVPDVCSLSNVSAVAAKDNATKDAAFRYPGGMVNFTADCGEAGYTASVHIFFYGQDNLNFTVRKYNPSNQSYGTVTEAMLSKVRIGGQPALQVSYAVTDGGSLDTDNSKNGVIVDPVGIAEATIKVPNTGLERRGD